MSGVLGGPLSGWMLQHFAAGQGGLAGWQWLFLLQGLPTVLLGLGVYFYLNDGIAQARWLSAEEKTVMQQALIDDEARRAAQRPMEQSFASVLGNVNVWMLGAIYFAIQMGCTRSTSGAIHHQGLGLSERWRHRLAQRAAISGRLLLHGLGRPFRRPARRAPLARGVAAVDGRGRLAAGGQ